MAIGTITLRIMPGTGREGHHTLANLCANTRSSQASSSIIENSNHITGLDTALLSIRSTDRYSRRTGARLVCDCTFELTVKFIARLW